MYLGIAVLSQRNRVTVSLWWSTPVGRGSSCILLGSACFAEIPYLRARIDLTHPLSVPPFKRPSRLETSLRASKTFPIGVAGQKTGWKSANSTALPEIDARADLHSDLSPYWLTAFAVVLY